MLNYLIIFIMINLMGATLMMQKGVSLESLPKLQTMLGTGMFLTLGMVVFGAITFIFSIVAFLG